MSALLDLAERCEKTEGPDRELDAAIYAHLNPPLPPAENDLEPPPGFGCDGFLADQFWGFHYTASIDAALTLVPEGWQVAAIEQDWRTRLWRAQLIPTPSPGLIAAFDEGRTVGWGTADSAESGLATVATPAFALCAAALRALAASDASPPASASHARASEAGAGMGSQP